MLDLTMVCFEEADAEFECEVRPGRRREFSRCGGGVQGWNAEFTKTGTVVKYITAF